MAPAGGSEVAPLSGGLVGLPAFVDVELVVLVLRVVLAAEGFRLSVMLNRLLTATGFVSPPSALAPSERRRRR